MKTIEVENSISGSCYFPHFAWAAAWNGSSFAQEIDPSEVVPAVPRRNPSARCSKKRDSCGKRKNGRKPLSSIANSSNGIRKAASIGTCLDTASMEPAKLTRRSRLTKLPPKFDQFKPISLYNLGCAYSLKNDADKSFDSLRKAIDAGFQQIDLFETDRIWTTSANTKHVLTSCSLTPMVMPPDKEMEAKTTNRKLKMKIRSLAVGKCSLVKKEGRMLKLGRMPPASKFPMQSSLCLRPKVVNRS